MSNLYGFAIACLMFASACVGYAGYQTQGRPRMVRDKVDMLPTNLNYRIPDPIVEPLKPKGIRVSIPDEPGVELFGFHGNLNKPIVGFQSGPLQGDVTRPVNGRWTFIDRNLQTKPGDVLHFWIFVQFNGLGYRKDNFRFNIKALKEVVIEPLTIKPAVISRPPPTVATIPDINNSIEENSYNKIEFQKMQAQLNETLSLLLTLNEKIDPLNRELKLMREIITDLARSTSGNTKLILRHNGAMIPGNSLEFVRSIVVSRLDLQDLYSKILAANQITGGIVFDVVSMYEKRLILTRARDALKTSKYKIEEYTEPMPPPNTDCLRVIDEVQFPTTSERDQPTTFTREPDQPTDILPTDSLDSYEDDIAKKIDIRMTTDEDITTSL